MIAGSIIFLLLQALIFCGEIPFIPERVQLVDKINSNFLVRGNIPILDEKIVMSQLKKQIQRVTGVKKQKQQLIVYSLINHYTDAESKSAWIEQQYFNQNPNEGKLYFYPILGFFFSPGVLPEFLIRIAASYYESVSYDKLQSFLELLRKQLQVGQNKIVYFHCTHGLDRTGLVAAAYKMKYQGAALKDVMKQNRALAKRDLKWTIVNGISWFCHQLRIGNPKIQCTLPMEVVPPQQELNYEL